MRISDGAARELTASPAREELWPEWSSAASRLVFQVGEHRAGAGNDLVLWDPRSGAERALVATPRREEGWSTWSPREARLAFAFRGGDPEAGIAIADVSRGAITVAATAPAGSFFLRPEFSPDGARLVAQRRSGADSQLWLIEPGREARALTGDPAWFDSKAYFTRDGSQIVYSRRPRAGGPHEIARIDVDGGAITRLAPSPGAEDHSARPSPRRDEVVFVSNRGGSYDAYLVDLSGGEPVPLTTTPERNEFAPRWSPDGERIALISAPGTAGLPRLSDPEVLKQLRVLVIDRRGGVLLDVPGFMPAWMPPW